MSRLIPKTLGIMNHEAIQGRRKVWKSGVASRHNLSPLVEIGLNDPPKSGFAMAPPAPPGTTRLSIPIYIIQSISDCFVLRLFLMHPWPFQTKNRHVHEVRKHRHHNIYWISVRKEEKRKEMLQLWRSTILNPIWMKGSSCQKNQILKRSFHLLDLNF